MRLSWNEEDAVLDLLCYLTKSSNIKSAYKAISPTCVVKLTNAKKPDRRIPQRSYILTIGKPNYAARKVIARCKRANEKFPIEAAWIFSYKRPTR